MLIVIHVNKGGKCLAVTSSASEKKKNYEKARGEGRTSDNDFSLVPS